MATRGMNGIFDGLAPSATRKSVIITGGASGIGFAMAQHFASQGHRVAVLDVNVADGQKAVINLAAEYPLSTTAFKRCDVSSWEDQAAVFADIYRTHDSIDVVMANAGISEQGSSSLVRVEADEAVKPALAALNVNLIGTIYSIKLAIHYMSKNEPGPTGSRGCIVCTASNAGIYPFPVAPLYAASKSGIIGLVRAMGQVLERSNIQINALAPAVLDTNIAPSKELVKRMVVTPMSTLVRGVAQLVDNPTLTGQVAEIHGESVTLRPHNEYVDDDTKRNLNTFWELGFA